MKNWGRLFAIFVAASVSAAQSTNKDQTPISIQLSVPHSVVKPGAPVHMKVHITNVCNSPVNIGARVLAYGELDPRLQYGCQNEAGAPVEKDYPVLLSMGDHPLTVLKPAEAYDEQVNLATACDLSQPGKYVIQVSQELSEQPKIIAKSNRVTVTITP